MRTWLKQGTRLRVLATALTAAGSVMLVRRWRRRGPADDEA